MNRNNPRCQWIALCARLTLIAFVSTLPGPATWAQASARVTPVTAALLSPASGASRAAVTAPVTIAPSAAFLRSGLVGAPTAAAASSPAPLDTAAALVSPEAAAAAPAAESAGAPARVSAIASLDAAARDANDGDTIGNSGVRFDGNSSRNGASYDGRPNGSSNAAAADDKPAQFPEIFINMIPIPGIGPITLRVKGLEGAINVALRAGGYAVAASSEKNDGGVATLVRISNPHDGSATMETLGAVKITGHVKPAGGVAMAQVSLIPAVPSDPERLTALTALAQNALEQLARLDPEIKQPIVDAILKEHKPELVAAMISMNMPFSRATKLALLGAPSAEERLQKAIVELGAHFKSKTVEIDADNENPDFLESVEKLQAKMEAVGMPDAIQKITLKEYHKYSEMNPKESEAQKVRTYLEYMLEMPWSQRTKDVLDLAKAREILDQDHSGLETVKERVLEFIALRKKTGNKKGAILAFTGPPGVGKTSIAASIAAALGRKFVRLSLGGVYDETVLRGHGRTYLGSMPGEIMRQMKNAGTVNPVMLMDEVDKMGREGGAGDPTAALLEILDPKQNATYRDRYLDVPYDLSEVLFVVTSNELSNIPEPLRNRMEIIEFDGYTTLEKLAIAKDHIIPEKLAATGLKPEEASLTADAIRRIIEGYTGGEAGVRTLQEKIEAVLRKISAWTETRGEKAPGVVDEGDLEKYLGTGSSPAEIAQNGVGVATGLAVRGHGGKTLNVEVSYETHGSGQLRLRKAFGDDIYDSAYNAYKYVKTHAAKYGLEKVDFSKIDVDINITPAGKVDGPSAGGLMVTAIISALTGRSVTPVLAMTGEITMRGDILPIGGLKQKVMAAHRMGYKQVIYPIANQKDVAGIPQEIRDEMTLKPAKTYDDIYPDAIETAVTGVPVTARLAQEAPAERP